MTQGVFVHGSRPKTKKDLTAVISLINEGGDPYSVVIEATSLFGNEFDGSLHLALECTCTHLKGEGNYLEGGTHQHRGPFYLVGPDPRTSRKWYAALEYNHEEEKWIVT